MAEKNSGDVYVQCPYEKSHMILQKRLQKHIIRCQKNYTGKEKVICPFNSSHHLDKKELNSHLTTCPERQSFENFRHSIKPADRLNSDQETKNQNEGIIPHESWDNDERKVYNPSAYTETANIVRQPVGMTRSQRISFRQAERQRLHLLRNNR